MARGTQRQTVTFILAGDVVTAEKCGKDFVGHFGPHYDMFLLEEAMTFCETQAEREAFLIGVTEGLKGIIYDLS